ncbi:HPF/RaiA family ribosome-associated protein [Ralstonia mannitolilytica]|uniref:HPF/RaiA family ribosome-associated protein n=1 Tax=Ralstonia mannitolilytica TaxID=105219 RepID=UPI0028F54A65|nr:HPF/RaiA family ribosome-associated protein [Ralstonia mannitolilytica]CAJ0743405.1 hypothetical protein R76696_04476 [Ralstonia mannitolilytica]
MSLPVDISFQGVPHSTGVEETVIAQAVRLARFRGAIMRCRVSLALAEKHAHHGKPFDVQVHVLTPHRTHISSNAADHDPHSAVRDAFTHMERMLAEACRNR